MKTIFKKTLIATALLAVAGVANAATIATTKDVISKESLETSGSIATAPAYVVTLNDLYLTGDKISFTFSQPVIDSSLPAANAVTVAPVADAGGVAGKSGITLGARTVSADGKTVTYTVTTDNTGVAQPTHVGVQFTIPAGVQTPKSSLASGLTVSFSATNSGGAAKDTTGGADRTKTLIEVVNQIKPIAVTHTVNKIDVNKDRKSFVGEGTATIVFGVQEDTTIIGSKRTYATTAVKHTLTGDFSWVKDDSATAGLQPKSGVFAAAGTCTSPAWTYSATTVTLACANINVNQGIIINPEANKVGVAAADVPVLPAASFTHSAVVNFASPTGNFEVADREAGAWSINGSTVTVPYMVHAYNKFNSIINVHNAGQKEGGIVIDVWDEAGKVVVANHPAGTSKPGSVVSVAGVAVQALVDKQYDLSKTTKFSVRVVTNVPAKDITVNSAYADVSTATATRTPVANDSAVQNKGDL